MANTYTPIATQTLSSSTTTVTFSSIPSTYTDLVLIMRHINTGAATAADGFVQINSDSGSNYSWTQLQGNGSAAASSRYSNVPNGLFWATDSSTNYSLTRFNFMNYSNTTTYKTVIYRQDESSYLTVAIAGLWRNTAAISTISLTAADNAGAGSPDQFATGTTFTLYGIKAA